MSRLTMFPVILCVLGASLSLTAKAAPCARVLQNTPTVEVQKDEMDSNTCFVAVTPRDDHHMFYRDNIVTDNGAFLVFNSFGKSDGALLTGAREYYFFPRTRTVDFSIDPRSNDVSVFMTNGDEFIFDSRTADLKSIGRGSIKVDPNVNADNNGGVEITRYDGLYLDAGFTREHEPVSEPDRDIVFHFKGKSCTVKVKDVFQNMDKNPTIRFSDADLATYLQTNCPGWK